MQFAEGITEGPVFTHAEGLGIERAAATWGYAIGRLVQCGYRYDDLRHTVRRMHDHGEVVDIYFLPTCWVETDDLVQAITEGWRSVTDGARAYSSFSCVFYSLDALIAHQITRPRDCCRATLVTPKSAAVSCAVVPRVAS